MCIMAIDPLPTAERYQAYLVRLWQDSAHGPWRATLQSVQTGEKLLFADLEQLFAFVRGQCTPTGGATMVEPGQSAESKD